MISKRIPLEREHKLLTSFKYKILISFICGLLLHGSAFSQVKIDSLLQMLSNHPQQDTARVNLLDKLTYFIRFNDPKKALAFANEELELSRKLNYNYGLVFAFNQIGTIYKNMGAYDKAMFYYIQASRVSTRKDSTVSKGVALAYNNMALIYQGSGQYERAEEYFNKALKLDVIFGSIKGLAREYGNLGKLYLDQQRYEVASTYIQKGFAMDSTINHKLGMVESLNDLALLNFGLGKDELVIYYLRRGELLNNNQCLMHLGMTYHLRAKLYQRNGDDKKALEYECKAFPIAKKVQDEELLVSSSKNLSMLYSQLGNFKKGYEYSVIYSGYLKEVANHKKNMMVAEIQEKYENENNQKEIKLLSASNEKFDYYNKRLVKFRNRLFVASCLLLVVLLLLIQQYRSKLKMNSTLMKKFAEVRDMNLILNNKNAEIVEKSRLSRPIKQKVFSLPI